MPNYFFLVTFFLVTGFFFATVFLAVAFFDAEGVTSDPVEAGFEGNRTDAVGSMLGIDGFWP